MDEDTEPRLVPELVPASQPGVHRLMGRVGHTFLDESRSPACTEALDRFRGVALPSSILAVGLMIAIALGKNSRPILLPLGVSLVCLALLSGTWCRAFFCLSRRSKARRPMIDQFAAIWRIEVSTAVLFYVWMSRLVLGFIGVGFILFDLFPSFFNAGPRGGR
jgi:hypothetical protein